jgi:hypothetical protein
MRWLADPSAAEAKVEFAELDRGFLLVGHELAGAVGRQRDFRPAAADTQRQLVLA